MIQALAALIGPVVRTIRSAIDRGNDRRAAENVSQKERRHRKAYSALLAWPGVLVEPQYQCVNWQKYGDGYLTVIRDMTWTVTAYYDDFYYQTVLEGRNFLDFTPVQYYNAIQEAAVLLPSVFDEQYAENAYQIWYSSVPCLANGRWAYFWDGESWVLRPPEWNGVRILKPGLQGTKEIANNIGAR